MSRKDILELVFKRNNPKSLREFWTNLRDSQMEFNEISKITVVEIRLFYDSMKVE